MTAKYNIEKYAGELPEKWDSLSDCYFQSKAFLIHTEKHNPCNQRYYTMDIYGDIKACAIVYTLRLDLLTFLRLKSPVKMHIVGVPCSVSCSGIFGTNNHVKSLQNFILQKEKGFLLFLNLTNLIGSNLASGATLPTILFQNRYTNWDNYLGSLRSDYRRRIRHIEKIAHGIQIEKSDFQHFTPEMHQQYLNVYKRSKDKLEKLDLAFFQNLKAPFRLTVCKHHYKVIGWNITLLHNRVYYFFLGGINYHHQEKHETYFQLMMQIMKDGIAEKVDWIDLGQTAEIPKMRLGGMREKRYMQAHHSNRLVNRILKLAEKLLAYSRKTPDFNVFNRSTR